MRYAVIFYMTFNLGGFLIEPIEAFFSYLGRLAGSTLEQMDLPVLASLIEDGVVVPT